MSRSQRLLAGGERTSGAGAQVRLGEPVRVESEGQRPRDGRQSGSEAEQPRGVVLHDPGHDLWLSAPSARRRAASGRGSAAESPSRTARVSSGRSSPRARADSGKYFGLQPDRSIQVLCLCVATESASSCHGTEGWAMMICRSGKSAATSSSSIGFDSAEPKPIRRACPRRCRSARCGTARHARLLRSPRTAGSSCWSLGSKPCTVGWNLKPAHAVVLDERRRAASTAVGALPRIDGAERDQHVVVAAAPLGDVGARDRRGGRAGCVGVDGEDDGGHPPLAVVRRRSQSSVGARSVGAEVRRLPLRRARGAARSARGRRSRCARARRSRRARRRRSRARSGSWRHDAAVAAALRAAAGSVSPTRLQLRRRTRVRTTSASASYDPAAVAGRRSTTGSGWDHSWMRSPPTPMAWPVMPAAASEAGTR